MHSPCMFCGHVGTCGSVCTSRLYDATTCDGAPAPPPPDLLARAVEAWREVPEAQRAAALAAIEKEASIAAGYPNLRGLVAHALDRAADLLRAAGGEV